MIDQGLLGLIVILELALIFPEKKTSADLFMLLFMVWPFFSISLYSICLMKWGTTPGKKVFEISIRPASPNQPLQLWQIFVRSTVWWIGFFTFGAGWALLLLRKDRRALHDLASETVAICPHDDPQKVPGYQTTLGHGWLLASSFVFVMVLALAAFMQIGHIRNTTTVTKVETPSITEEAAWLIFLDTFEPGTLVTNDDLEKNFIALLSNKENPTSPWNCALAAGRETLCNSYNFLANNQTGETSKTFPAFAVWAEFKNVPENEKPVWLKDKILKTPLLTAPYLAFKYQLAKSLLKRGEFSGAVQSLKPDIDFLFQNPIDTEVKKAEFAQLTTPFCQADVFENCGKKSRSQVCESLDFWNGFSDGCALKDAPSPNGPEPQVLGYWYKKAKSSPKPKELKVWFNEIQERNWTPEAEPFFRAIDFVLTTQNPQPEGLMEKISKVSQENPLWAWSHLSAHRAFGPQWLKMIDQPDQQRVAILNFSVSERMIAAEPKKMTPKKKKRKKRR